MKILFLTNNSVSTPLAKWLADQPERNKVIIYQEKLIATDLVKMQPDLVVSYSYRHILKRDVLDLLPNKFINLHISYLPFNRGADPNAWSFLEGTPKGVSIHLIDEGIDTGQLLIQREIPFDEDKVTLGQTYSILQDEIQKLFQENWDNLKDGKIIPVAQVGKGTFHYAKEFAEIKGPLMGEEGWNVNIKTFRSRFNK